MLHLVFFVLLYFLPAIIGRDKQDATGIFLVNLFLGWAVSGWVFARLTQRSLVSGLT
jgi:Superinfection immunity protein